MEEQALALQPGAAEEQQHLSSPKLPRALAALADCNSAGHGEKTTVLGHRRRRGAPIPFVPIMGSGPRLAGKRQDGVTKRAAAAT